jgi:hypothetical protein
MHKIRVYVDTSVFGGTQDEDFAEISKLFFKRVHEGSFVALLSTETLRELVKAPDAVQAVWKNLPSEAVEDLHINDEMQELAKSYIDANVLGQASEGDALHVAAATVAGADLILSWNFKHIVNFDKIRGFNSVNVSQGYRSLTILSPFEVSYEEQNENI